MRPSTLDRGLFLALLVFVAGRCLVPMDETDLFFNLRLGEIVLQTGHVPRTNLLSFTWPAQPEINLAWLFQMVLALAHRAGGIRATVLLKTAFVLATFAVLWRVGRRRGAHAALLAPVLALAAWAAEPRFVERPHLVTFLGLALTLLAIERAEAGRPRALWLLVPAGLIWANANSCFFLAPAVLLLYAVGALADCRTERGAGGWPEPRAADARRAALVAVALLPLIFATPAGTGALRYIANHFRMPSLRPLQEYRTAVWPIDGPFFFLAGALLVALAVAGRGRLRAFLPALALGLLGWRRIRFVAEFALLAGPTVAAAATAWWAERAERWRVASRSPIVSLALIALLAGLTVGPRLADARAGMPWFDIRRQSDLVPEDAIRFAEESGLRGRMYNDLEVGSYLTWDGWPRFRVFQDPRINSYPDEFHALLRRPDLGRAEWEALLDRFGVTSALITYPAVNPRGALFDPARWALVYRSSEALVFARRAPGRDALLAARELPLTFRYSRDEGLTAAALETEPAASPVLACEWRRRLGDFFLEGGAPERAGEAYRAALLDDDGEDRDEDREDDGQPAGPTPCLEPSRRQATRRALAALALRLGDPAGAAALYRGMTDPAARTSRAFALLRLHRPAEALEELDQALRLPARDGDGGAGGNLDADLDVDLLLGRGLALQELHRDDEAAAALRAFLRAAPPDHLAAPEARARLQQLTGRVTPRAGP